MSNILKTTGVLARCCGVTIALAVVFTFSTVWAGWLPNGVPVCTVDGFQGSLVSTPDGQGGAVMVWQDQRDATLAIYAQRIDANGNLLWTTNGVKVSGTSNQQFHPWICGDGSGGAWVVWNDREGGYGDIYVQRLDAAGSPAWGPPGGTTVRMGSAIVDNSLPVCASDGGSGVVVAWVQEPYPPSGDYQVVAQRIDGAGTVRWTVGGELVGNDIGAGEEISIATNEEQVNGVFLGWRSSTGAGIAQWVDGNGAPRWNTIYGHSVGMTTAGSRVRVADRARVQQGAYVMYRWQGGLHNYNHISVASVDSSRYVWWNEAVDSEGLSDDVGNDYRVIDNGLNGVYCVWDRVDGGDGNGVYAMSFESDGDVDWGPRLVSDTAEGNYLPDATVQYGSWNIFISWVGDDGGVPRLKYSKVERTMGGVSSDVLVPGGYSSYRPTIVATAGSLISKPIIAWMDERDPADTDIYATGLESGGAPTHPNLVVTDMYPDVDPGIAGGEPHAFYVMVKNLGTSQAGSFWTTIFPDQATPPTVGETPPPSVQSVHCAALDAGDSLLVEVLIDAPPAADTWTMWGFADYQDDVDEFDDEDDNVFGPMSYEWVSLPNLVITTFTLDEDNPRLGEFVQATIHVYNAGTAPAPAFDVDFYQDLAAPPTTGQAGDQTYHRSGLSPGGTIILATAPFTNTSELARWSCYVQVDTQDDATESDEDDNVAGPLGLKWDPPLHDGWPHAGGAGFRSSPAIASLDDYPATKEIVVGCDDGYLYAWDFEGNDLPGWPVHVGDTLFSSPAVGDIMGDFHNEVVVGCNDGHLYAFDHQGALLWSHAAGYPVNTTPALEDLDQDGKLEVIFAVGASSGGGYADALRGNGTQYPQLTEMNLAGSGATSPAVGDVDDDGDFEIAVVSYNVTKIDDRSLVYLFQSNGLPYSVNWPAQIDTIVIAPPVLGDAANAATGPLEVVVGGMNGLVYVFNLNGASWPSPPRVPGRIETSPSLIQYDGDKYHEILVSSRHWVETFPPFGYFVGTISAIDDDASTLAKWPKSTGTWLYGAALAPPVAIRQRVLVGTPGRILTGWKNETGNDAPEFPVDAVGPVEAALAIGDLDGDGFYDVVAASANDSVYCYDFSASSQFAANDDPEWPMFRNGRTRTGCYVLELPVGIDEEAGEDAPAVTALRSVYPNPFNPSTTVSFDLAERSRVTIAVYDVTGRRVAVLKDGVVEAGRHVVPWNGTTDTGGRASSGVYFCRLVAGKTLDVKKMVLLK